jgi:hypothetical protein
LTSGTNQGRQKAKPAIHVPIPIPIVSRGPTIKNLVKKEQANKGDKTQLESAKPAQNGMFMSEFYGEQILSKKIELDKRMKETTQNLESKLIKAVEINEEDDIEEEELTFDNNSNGAEFIIERGNQEQEEDITQAQLGIKMINQQDVDNIVVPPTAGETSQ